MKIRGIRNFRSTLITWAKKRAKMRPRITNTTFAEIMPAKIWWTTSGWPWKSMGPGWRLWMVSAPMRTAVAASPGIPRVIMGRTSPPVLAFSPHWAAATPAGFPLPKLSGSFDARLVSA